MCVCARVRACVCVCACVRACARVCVCLFFCIIHYVNCFGRTVLELRVYRISYLAFHFSQHFRRNNPSLQLLCGCVRACVRACQSRMMYVEMICIHCAY